MAPDKQSLVEGLVQSHGEQLRLFLLRRIRNRADIADLVQEVFLRMLRVPDAEAIRSPEAYLFTVARHVVQQHTLQQSRATASLELQDMLAASLAESLLDPALEVSAGQSVEALRKALADMPTRPRAAFLMHRREGLTIEEIGKRLGVSRPMAKKYLAKALVHCRRALDQGG